jgi:hypothetical protein
LQSLIERELPCHDLKASNPDKVRGYCSVLRECPNRILDVMPAHDLFLSQLPSVTEQRQPVSRGDDVFGRQLAVRGNIPEDRYGLRIRRHCCQ